MPAADTTIIATAIAIITAMGRCLCTVRGCFYTCLTLANVAACLAFLAFAVECTLVHGEPVETCYDSFLAYREVNKAMLGLLYGTST